jgi:nucleoside-diphosphate-sugar epimerase
MKITILGSEGYIGSALTPLLVKQFGAENIQRIDACL